MEGWKLILYESLRVEIECRTGWKLILYESQKESMTSFSSSNIMKTATVVTGTCVYGCGLS